MTTPLQGCMAGYMLNIKAGQIIAFHILCQCVMNYQQKFVLLSFVKLTVYQEFYAGPLKCNVYALFSHSTSISQHSSNQQVGFSSVSDFN